MEAATQIPKHQGPDDVVAAVRDAVLRGEYAPGYRLIEADLCSEFGVSRSVVRTAITQLVSDGLVEVQRHKGARVRRVTLEEVIEITEIRLQIERLLARKAAERVTDDEADELRELGVQMRLAVEEDDTLAHARLKRLLHARVRDIANHQIASDILDRLQPQLVRHDFRLGLQGGRARTSLAQHDRIIDAIVRRDPEGADAAMHEHLADALARLAQMPPHDSVPVA